MAIERHEKIISALPSPESSVRVPPIDCCLRRLGANRLAGCLPHLRSSIPSLRLNSRMVGQVDAQRKDCSTRARAWENVRIHTSRQLEVYVFGINAELLKDKVSSPRLG